MLDVAWLFVTKVSKIDFYLEMLVVNAEGILVIIDEDFVVNLLLDADSHDSLLVVVIVLDVYKGLTIVDEVENAVEIEIVNIASMQIIEEELAWKIDLQEIYVPFVSDQVNNMD